MTQTSLFPTNEEEAPTGTKRLCAREALADRFLAHGFEAQALGESDLLDLLLTGARGLARRLLETFQGDFAEIIAASPDALRACGASKTQVAILKAVHAAALHLSRTRTVKRVSIGSWSALLDYCTAQIAREPVEQFRVLFLDRKNVLIADECLSRGTVDHTPVYPREIAKRALALNASAMVVTHNHPSGDPTPSQADIAMTREIAMTMKAIGVTLHDHVVIGRSGHASFKSLGLLV